MVFLKHPTKHVIEENKPPWSWQRNHDRVFVVFPFDSRCRARQSVSEPTLSIIRSRSIPSAATHWLLISSKLTCGLSICGFNWGKAEGEGTEQKKIIRIKSIISTSDRELSYRDQRGLSTSRCLFQFSTNILLIKRRISNLRFLRIFMGNFWKNLVNNYLVSSI